MPESHSRKALSMEAGIQSTSGLTMPVLTQADSPSMLAPSLEEVSTTTPTVGNTFSPSAAPAPTHTTISQLPPSIPTSTQTKPLAPAAPADNKPSSSSSQPTAPSFDAKYAPTKPTCIPVNVISVTTTPSAPSAISTTAPVLTAGVATVGPAFKNTTLQDHDPTPTKPSETTAPTGPKLAASITPTEISVSTQETNNTHSSTIDSSNPLQIGHDHVNRPLPPIPALDWIVPYESKIHVKSVEERMLPTIIAAGVERKKYVERAMMKGYTMNIAIGIQLLVGALTTAISALVTGREITIVLPILGGISTLTAAFLTRARGSNEPERSLMVAKDLEQFIRECKAFLVDFGSSTEDVHKREVQRLRNRFEEILRDADVEKK